MYYVGLDASTHFGFGVVKIVNGKPDLIRHDVFEEQTNCIGIERALQITDQVIESLPPWNEIGLIALEGYSFGSPQRLADMVEIGTIMRYQLMKGNYPLRLCPPSNLKKFVTGKGNSDKKRVILDAHKRWGFDLSDDNEADAACLAIMAATYCDAYVPNKIMTEEAKKLLPCR